MAQYTLDDIRAAAEAKFGSTDILVGDTTCKLVNALQLPKERRDQLMAIQHELDAENADQEAIISNAIRVIAESPHQADVLLGAIGGNLAMMVEVFNRYSSQSEVGEASASAG